MDDGLGLKLSELVDFDTAPTVLVEDPPASGKGAYKVPKRRSGEKSA